MSDRIHYYYAGSEHTLLPEGKPIAKLYTQAELDAAVLAEREAASSQPPRVKPLVWRDSFSVIRADTKFGSYLTSASGKLLTLGIAPLAPIMACANLDDAKAAAQADYERRILAALEPPIRARTTSPEWQKFIGECSQLAQKVGDDEAALIQDVIRIAEKHLKETEK